MIKYLIGASALAVTATAAQAQVGPTANPDSVSEVSVKKTASAPVSSSFRSSVNDGDKAATAATVTGADAVINSVSGTNLPTLNATGNKSVVDQDGNENDAFVDQQGGTRGWSVIKQNGSENVADVDQDNGTANSLNTHNAAFVQQIGSEQTAQINQARDGSGTVAMNRATIQQGGFTTQVLGPLTSTPSGFNNEARIDQTGNGNSANIAQGVGAIVVGGSNDAFIEQVRLTINGVNSENKATVQQRFNGDAAIFQRGAVNSQAVIVQGLGLAGRIDSDIVQTGNGNLAANYQNVELGSADSFIKQNGNNNEAFVNQSGTAYGNRVSELFQTGNDNFAQVQQTVAPDSLSLVSQNGNNNVAIVKQ
ncbi:hypothetical protein LQ953_10440 [Sphingomonas sp. IC-56]|uniref:hypothetical protein n=1 Tax=Sphingomonas sp. IC-56 TaxID=2898529 RepID=UPI001E4C419A|nr:hypothetical protein [Sphingomonas sp. IC-56]MCD2324431.1 hypothetical protein [Sphingomonas sp. IC-56]